MTSRHLARFAARSRWEDVPEAARHEARRSLLNLVGTALGGSADAAARRTAATLLPFSGTAEATIIGRAERADCMTAAFLNALAGNVFDFDDTHPETIIHPSAPVAPPLLALAERRPMTGRDLLHAFVLGVEVECRIGNAISPQHYKRGWHITSTCGVFGAAAAVGRAIGLDEERMLWALGSAAAQASGLVETLGFMAKSTGVGHSARGGLLAALLAENGVEGPERPLEGPRGFVTVTGDGPDLSRLTEGLGETWEIAKNNCKPYPAGVVLNSVIDGCLALRAAEPDIARTAAAIVVMGHPLLRERADRPAVTTGREAQVSAQHAVAVALLDGAAGVREFADERVAAADVLALRSKVTVRDAPGIPVEGARLEVTLESGRTIVETVAAARGSAARPLSDDELEAKFRTLAAHGCPGFDPAPLIAALWSIEDAPDAAAVARLAAYGP
ncbi:MAG: MmgE/PrpD family protein [Alphaproteobacteria bacterium]